MALSDIFGGARAQVFIAGTSLHCSKWSVAAKVDEIEITVANNTGSKDFTCDMPRIELRMELVWDATDNPFAAPVKIVPGKNFTDLWLYFEKTLLFPSIYFPAGMWTSFELLNAVRDCVRFNCTALATQLPSLPTKGRAITYQRWNGFDLPEIPGPYSGSF
jgi:hypothetical protein